MFSIMNTTHHAHAHANTLARTRAKARVHKDVHMYLQGDLKLLEICVLWNDLVGHDKCSYGYGPLWPRPAHDDVTS